MRHYFRRNRSLPFIWRALTITLPEEKTGKKRIHSPSDRSNIAANPHRFVDTLYGDDNVFFMAVRKNLVRHGISAWLLLVASACASQRPILASNEHLMRVGHDVAKQDIDGCMAWAKETATESGGVVDAATSSVVGAAVGGTSGAIFGNAGQGAAAGAVGGAVGSLTQALLQGLFRPKPPPPSHQQFVNSCLRQKGYEPVGWK